MRANGAVEPFSRYEYFIDFIEGTGSNALNPCIPKGARGIRNPSKLAPPSTWRAERGPMRILAAAAIA
jgi:hypothetical protein